MKTPAHYYRHHPYIDCGVLGSNRDPHRSLQMTASVAAAAMAYYPPAGCLHGVPLTAAAAAAGSLGYHGGLSTPSSSAPPDRLVKTDPSPPMYGPRLSPSADRHRQIVGLERGSTDLAKVNLRDFSGGLDLLFQSTNSRTSRSSGFHPSSWTDVERVRNEAKAVLGQPPGDGGGDGRHGSRKDGRVDADRGNDSTAGKEVEEKQALRFPWMKTTKSHAHQWKAQWSGKKLYVYTYCVTAFTNK